MHEDDIECKVAHSPFHHCRAKVATGAILYRTNLSEAYLKDAFGITFEELEKQAKSLQGATMPDGTKHP